MRRKAEEGKEKTPKKAGKEKEVIQRKAEEGEIPKKVEKACFAAGCFWEVQEEFEKIPGVVSTIVGYTGGSFPNPAYKNVCTGKTGHAEAILIQFDPKQVSYSTLLSAFWEMHDPTTPNRQGPDVGHQYRSAIFFFSKKQEQDARKSLEEEQKKGFKRIVTEIAPAGEFYPAEEYHQQYLKKNGLAACRI